MPSHAFRWRTWVDVGMLSTVVLLSGMFLASVFGPVARTLDSLGPFSKYLAQGLLATAVISVFVAMILLTVWTDA